MTVLDGRWPTPSLPRSAPADWDALLLYMLGEVTDKLYRCGCISSWVRTCNAAAPAHHEASAESPAAAKPAWCGAAALL